MEYMEIKEDDGTTRDIAFRIGSYEGNRSLSVKLYTIIDGEPDPYAGLTVNLAGTPPYCCAYIDTGNFPRAVEFLQSNQIAHPTGVLRHSGWNQYPLYVFSPEILKRVDPEGFNAYEAINGIHATKEQNRKSR